MKPWQETVIRHVFVEGWAAPVVWGGVRLADVIGLVGISPLAGYVAFESADLIISKPEVSSQPCIHRPCWQRK